MLAIMSDTSRDNEISQGESRDGIACYNMAASIHSADRSRCIEADQAHLIDVDEKTITSWRWQKNLVATSLSCEIFVLILSVKSVES